jgi:Rrf2 family protein
VRLETTRKSDLAVKALIALAPAQNPVKAGELADALDASPSFMAHVMTPLVAQGWVSSDPGRRGGYRLVVDLAGVSVLALIEAVEGPTDTGECVVGDRPCTETGSCALHLAWMRARELLSRELAATSIADAAPSVPIGGHRPEARKSAS